MNFLRTIGLVLGLLIIFIPNAFAHSGCCSHHNGVCGCGCCDGTALSATCAPYYPECNSDYSNTTTTTTNDSYASYSQAPAIPTCPSHSTYDASQNQCVCNEGYVPTTNQSGCVPKPPVVAAPVATTSSRATQQISSQMTSQAFNDESSSLYQVPAPITTQSSNYSETSSNPLGTILLTGILGGGGYYWYKKRKNKK